MKENGELPLVLCIPCASSFRDSFSALTFSFKFTRFSTREYFHTHTLHEKDVGESLWKFCVCFSQEWISSRRRKRTKELGITRIYNANPGNSTLSKIGRNRKRFEFSKKNRDDNSVTVMKEDKESSHIHLPQYKLLFEISINKSVGVTFWCFVKCFFPFFLSITSLFHSFENLLMATQRPSPANIYLRILSSHALNFIEGFRSFSSLNLWIFCFLSRRKSLPFFVEQTL